MMPIDADALDAIAARFAARGGQPGLAYGVIAGGELVHSGGRGERWLGGPLPDADTVFRIASMTKSFTAALVLMLRDRGALRPGRSGGGLRARAGRGPAGRRPTARPSPSGTCSR